MLRIFSYLFALTIALPAMALNNLSNVAFFYGPNPPLDELRAYNVVVVHPQEIISPRDFNTASSTLYAYVTIGELDADSDYASQTDASWTKGENPAWNSAVMDMSNPEWRNFLLTKVISPLWEEGYRGFFLDTLDSYQLLHLTPEQNKEQLAGLVELIKSIKEKFPEAGIISNRGFEIMPDIHQYINAVAVESLFSGWNNTKKRYQPVNEEERQALLKELQTITQNYQLPIIVIDYLPPKAQEKARELAKRIDALGYIPWITDGYLSTMGIGRIEILPRKILLLYNDKTPAFNELSSLPVYSNLAFILQYMGYIPVLQHVDNNLPEGNLKGSYAGIISWFNKPVIKDHQKLEIWLKKQIDQHIPIVFLDNLGFPLTSSLMQVLNLSVQDGALPPKELQIDKQAKTIGYEVMPKPDPLSFYPLKANADQVWLQINGKNTEQVQDTVAIMPWGGYALAPFNNITLPNGQVRWVINPFEFFNKALKLPMLPVPDVTTENGRRILTIHIDGDAFISKVPWLENEYAGDVIYSQILSQYKLPTTVSLIQREFEIITPNAQLLERLTKTARAIFTLPWIQMATHTYSHPLKWGALIEGEENTPYLSYPDPNYRFSYDKEIKGSTDFINSHFAPANKQVKTIFWSGDANIQDRPLAISAKENLLNINGMAKIYSNSDKSLTNLGPLGMYRGANFQVFSPIPNDFEYTDNWAFPLYAFQNVIKTFELTESPQRYKPASIYYHFYSANDQAALTALKRVYSWAVQQKTTPLQISDYINKVMDFNKITFSRTLDGKLVIANNGQIRELRWPQRLGEPDLDSSRNLIGYNQVNSDYYIHLGSEANTVFNVSKLHNAAPYLIEANTQVMDWKTIDNQRTRVNFSGYVPIEFKLANMNNCRVYHNNEALNLNEKGFYSLGEGLNGTVEIQCNKRS